MSKFDNIFKNYILKEMDLMGSGSKAVTSPQLQTAMKAALKQAGTQGDAVKALGSTLMGDPHLQDFNKLLDPQNTEFKNIDQFLQKHQDLASRFAELGMIQPKKTEVGQDKKEDQTNSSDNTQQNQNQPQPPQGNSTSYGGNLQGI
jgi:hypothetical protein